MGKKYVLVNVEGKSVTYRQVWPAQAPAEIESAYRRFLKYQKLATDPLNSDQLRGSLLQEADKHYRESLRRAFHG
jgi:hypothetical protein